MWGSLRLAPIIFEVEKFAVFVGYGWTTKNIPRKLYACTTVCGRDRYLARIRKPSIVYRVHAIVDIGASTSIQHL